MCLELFGRVFLDDVGSENNSILNELGRYDVKESKFKRDMEKLRNGHNKDLYIEGVWKFVILNDSGWLWVCVWCLSLCHLCLWQYDLLH